MCWEWLWLRLGAIHQFKVNKEGVLEAPEIGDRIDQGWDIHNIGCLFSCADSLKSIAINMFGLSYSQVAGTDEQKNTLTNIRWADIPGVIAKSKWDELEKSFKRTNIQKPEDFGLIIAPDDEEFLTGRRFMEVLGTDIMRRMYGDCHVNSLLSNIEEQDSELSIVVDIRFPNEVEKIKAAGGKVIRLTRNPHDSKSKSEIALDDYPLDNFDLVIDNANMTIEQQNEYIIKHILEAI